MRELMYRLLFGFLFLPTHLQAQGGLGEEILLAGIVDVLASATLIWWGLYVRKNQLKTLAATVIMILLVAYVATDKGLMLVPKILLYSLMGNALVLGNAVFGLSALLWCGVWFGIAILVYSRSTGILRVCIAATGFTVMVATGCILLYQASPNGMRKVLDAVLH